MQLGKQHRLSFGAGLTTDQFKALSSISRFYNDKKKLNYILSGAAGTGKTYILQRFLQYINNRNAALTAPTHKAVRVIERATGRAGITIQSLHGLRPDVSVSNFDIDNLRFNTIGDAKIANYATVLTDECSMIPDSIFELNTQRGKTFRTKIIYIGDSYQLAPVEGQRYSSTFDLEDGYKLTEIVRQKTGNALLDVFPILQADIDNNTSGFINHLYQNPNRVSNGVGYNAVTHRAFYKEVIKQFNSEEMANDINHARMLCWTNMSVLLWNKAIRARTIDGYDKRLITEDDMLTAYKNIVDDYFAPIITNSDDYFVLDIHERTTEYGFRVYMVTLESVETKSVSKVYIADHHHKNWIRYYDILNRLHFDAKYAEPRNRKRRYDEYSAFKDRYLSLINFPLVEEVQELFNFAEQQLMTLNDPSIVWTETLQFYKDKENIRARVNKDLDYGFALTVHKSQGSTYKYAFVNLLDIAYHKGDSLKRLKPIQDSNKRPYAKENRNKLLYTASTRATDKVTFLV